MLLMLFRPYQELQISIPDGFIPSRDSHGLSVVFSQLSLTRSSLLLGIENRKRHALAGFIDDGMLSLQQPPDSKFGVEEGILESILEEKAEFLITEAPTGYRVVDLKTKTQKSRITEFVFYILVREIRREADRFELPNQLGRRP